MRSALFCFLLLLGTAHANEPVIVQLETRTHWISVHQGQDSTLYTVKAKTGKTLVSAIGEKELKKKLPELYDKIKKAVARGAELLATSDARL